MMTTRKVTALFAVLPVLAFCATPSSAANLVTNGSFESPALGNGSFGLFSSIPGWTLSSGPSIEVQNHAAGSPFDGNQFVELDSTASSGITQTVGGLTNGQTYDFSFAFSARPGTPATDNIMKVNFGVLSTSVSADGTGLSNTAWTLYNFTFVAIGSTEQLTFTDLGTSDGLGSYLDAVSITPANSAVPEPSQMATLAFGLLGLGGLLLSARKRAIAQRIA